MIETGRVRILIVRDFESLVIEAYDCEGVDDSQTFDAFGL